MTKNETSCSKENDPFLQRAIEHWLDSANEMTYQPLFCSLLALKGYALKYSIKNTNFEQGKDVLAIAPDGTPAGFQLKGGNISLSRWRTEVKPELEALVECAIQHPDINKDRPHISYLVTNGEVDDSVRSEIVSLNEGRWKDSPLRYWTRGDLLHGFQAMAGGILPRDARTYKDLVDMLFADGNDRPEPGRISSFLIGLPGSGNRSKEQIRRDMAAAALYSNMIMGPYRASENHAAAASILVVLLAVIFYWADSSNLDEKYWRHSYDLVWGDLLQTLGALETELVGGFDEMFDSPFDRKLIPYRKHAAVSMLFPYKVSQLIIGDRRSATLGEPTSRHLLDQTVKIWGEASYVPLLLLALLVEHQKPEMARELVQKSIEEILEANGRNSKLPIGLLPPYYDIDFAVRAEFGMLDQEVDHSTKEASFLLKPLVDMAVRMGLKDFLKESWMKISFMQFEEFVPAEVSDFYLWRAEQGENRSVIPKKEKSWKELVDEANETHEEKIPRGLRMHPEFFPLFLAVFVHRVNPASVGFLSDVLRRRNQAVEL